MFATLQRGLAETMASARAASFQSLALCGSVHIVVKCVMSAPMAQCMHVRCDARLVQAPGKASEQKTGSPQHHPCAPRQLQSQGGSRPGSAPLDHEGSGALSPGLLLSTLHKSFQHGGVGFIPLGNHSMILSHTDGLGKSH